MICKVKGQDDLQMELGDIKNLLFPRNEICPLDIKDIKKAEGGKVRKGVN